MPKPKTHRARRNQREGARSHFRHWEPGRRRLLQNVSSASEANETTHTKKVVGGEVVPHVSYDEKTETLHQKYTEKSFVNGTNSSVAGTKYTNEKDVEFGTDSIATVVDKTTIRVDKVWVAGDVGSHAIAVALRS